MGFPDITYTENYISQGKLNTISLKNLYDTLLVGDIDDDKSFFKIPFDDFFIKYHDELSTSLRLYNLPESMFFQPKAVSLTLYGTTELWLGLLRVNGMRNISEFSIPMIRIYDPDAIQQYIDIFFKRENKS